MITFTLTLLSFYAGALLGAWWTGGLREHDWQPHYHGGDDVESITMACARCGVLMSADSLEGRCT